MTDGTQAVGKVARRSVTGWVAAGLLLGSTALTGCQIDVAGQTLPSPTYLKDDVQYYAPGPEFKLAREAAALKEQSEAYDTGRGDASCCP